MPIRKGKSVIWRQRRKAHITVSARGLPDNLLIVVSFGCSPKNIDRLFPSFHDFLLRHGKMHRFRHIAFDDTMVYSATDVEGKRNMSELLIPLNYRMMPNNYAISVPRHHCRDFFTI